MTNTPPSATAAVSAIARQLFACAAEAGNSEQKRAHFIHLPEIIWAQAIAIAQERYAPEAFTAFAVTDPKLREIFAPAFADRLVHQWLVRHIEPWWDRRFIDDSFANRKGKGTQAAIARLQHFMRQPGHHWYCQLDIRAFFPSIDRRILLQLWQDALPRLPWPVSTRRMLDQVAQAILSQNPVDPAPKRSGDLALLSRIPAHKSLYGALPHVGMPIGSLTSQFFANVYLNELDQFVKHHLKIRGYVRYVDDFVLLGDNPHTLQTWKSQIEAFLHKRLHLQLHPNKVVLQKSSQGIDFLGNIIHPQYSLVRQRTVRALRRRVAWFCHLLAPQEHPWATPPMQGDWRKWLDKHAVFHDDGNASSVLIKRMLSTLNSYYGLMKHANTYRLRKHIYHQELGILRRYFLPVNKDYHHLKIRAHWLMRSD